jgi:tetratricopeptide (TPR) repeat protein
MILTTVTRFWGIFWIDASSEASAIHTFSAIAKIGGVDANIRAAKNWLSSLELPWLLLIDNADDPKISIEDYFPEGERGFILITTRVPKNKRHGTIGKRCYQFENLETEAASELLLKAADITCPWDSSAREAAAHITSALGCLPLALIHAGTAIANKLCELGNYMNFYRKNWERIRQAWKDSGHFQDEEDDANMKVYSSYEVLYRKLEQTTTRGSQDAIELLKVFSFIRREDIRFDFLTAAAKNPWLEIDLREKGERKTKTSKIVSKPKSWLQFFREAGFLAREVIFMDRTPPVLPGMLRDVLSPASLEDFDFRLRAALSLLTQMSLISHHEETNSYFMHPLVHTWVRERPQMSIGEQAIWCQAATTTLAQAIILSPFGSTDENTTLQRDLLPHVVELRSRQVQIRERIVENQRLRKLPWPALEPRFGRRQAIESVKFSLVYSQGGLWNEAAELQLAVKDFLCKKLGLEHQLTMDIMLLLSVTYMQQTRHNKAAGLQRQVLQACMDSLGPDHPKTLKVMDTLGSNCTQQSRFNEARQLHEKAIERMTEILGADHEDTLTAVDNLGKVMSRYFCYDKAKDLHLKAMTGMKSVLGPTDLRTLTAMENVALAYTEVGGELLDPAHVMMVHVLEERRKKLGKEQPYTLLAIANLARIKIALNKTDEAENLLRTALPIAERNLGKNHAGTLFGRVWLSQALVRQERYSEAEEILTEVVQRQRYEDSAREDGEHTDRIQALWFLLKCYQLQGKIEDAIRIGNELSEGVRTIGGEGLGKQHIFARLLADKQQELRVARRAPVPEPTGKLTQRHHHVGMTSDT